jgi:acyl dehydratase/proteasome lid subunit RPN8/RPN11
MSRAEPAAAAALVLPTELRERLLAHVRAALPAEAVGLLGGAADGRVRRVVPLPNVAGPRSFLADPRAQYEALRALAAEGLELVAVYHSHPGGTATLSPADRHFAERVGALQLVVALGRPGQAGEELRAFRCGRALAEVPVVSAPSPAPVDGRYAAAMTLVTTHGIDDVKALVGKPIGPSEWRTITQEMIDTFADLSGDDQWIHVDAERAKTESPFGTTVAHGNLTLSTIDGFRKELVASEGFKLGVNYGWNKVRFPAPVPSGARIRATAEVVSVDEVGGGWWQVVTRFTVEAEGNEKPVCVAESVGRALV